MMPFMSWLPKLTRVYQSLIAKETKELSREKRDKIFSELQSTEETNPTDDAIAYDLPETETSEEPKRQRGGKKGSMCTIVSSLYSFICVFRHLYIRPIYTFILQCAALFFSLFFRL